MMDVPADVLQKLICENCSSYLSRGPVLILDNGKNVCGRCEIVKQNVKRNVQYEELAKLMKFPCQYEKYGCQQRISFEENLSHEESCSYHKIRCPNTTSEQCEWTGMQHKLLDHFQQDHPGYVVQNPMNLTYSMNKSSLQNYLMSAFHVLFLIQTKVCFTTKAIYHSVRLIGDTKHASRYSFDLDIKSEDGKLSKQRVVAPQGCMGLTLNESVMTDFNLLFSFLGKCQSVTLTLTVRITDGATVEQIEQDMKRLSVAVLCVKCQKTTEPVWHDDNGWHCKTCGATKELSTCNICCEFHDIKIKCRKHECYYCKHIYSCPICNTYLEYKSLETHYSQDHSAITHKAGSTWSADMSISHQWSIIQSNFGQALCHYWMYGSKLFMYIRTPLRTEELYLYKCVVEISHPVTRNKVTWTADVQYFYAWDWELNKPNADLFDYIDGKHEFNVKIDFIKNVHV